MKISESFIEFFIGGGRWIDTVLSELSGYLGERWQDDWPAGRAEKVRRYMQPPYGATPDTPVLRSVLHKHNCLIRSQHTLPIVAFYTIRENMV